MYMYCICTSIMVSSLEPMLFSTSSFSLLNIIGFNIYHNYNIPLHCLLPHTHTHTHTCTVYTCIHMYHKLTKTHSLITSLTIHTCTHMHSIYMCIHLHTNSLTKTHSLTVFNSSTCSSVFRSPNCCRKDTCEGKVCGSRKLSRLNSSSTLFCSGVPVNSALCSILNLFRPSRSLQFLFLRR